MKRMMEGTHMPEATLHDGSTIEIEIHGAGPTLLLPVNPQPVTGPQADEMRKYGTDPALGQSLIKGLSDAFRVVAFDYEGQCLRHTETGHADACQHRERSACCGRCRRGGSVRLLWLLLAGDDWASTRHPHRPPLGTHHGWLSTTERAIRGDAPRHYCDLRDGERRSGQRRQQMNPNGPAWLYQGIRPSNLSRCTRRCRDSMTEPPRRRSPVLVSALWVRRMRSSTTNIGEM